jgi:hypothetical protein
MVNDRLTAGLTGDHICRRGGEALTISVYLVAERTEDGRSA